MDTHDNDNFDPWTSLGLATAMLLNRLRCAAQLLDLTQIHEQQDEHPPGQSEAGNQCEKEATEKLDQISPGVAARIGEVG